MFNTIEHSRRKWGGGAFVVLNAENAFDKISWLFFNESFTKYGQ